MKKSIKDKTCCFTGHRKIERKDYELIREKLKSKIIYLINKGVCYFGVGGALGFDTLVALTILELKNEYTHIRLIMVLPCCEQDKYWNVNDKKIYNEIIKKADKIRYISDTYTKECMFIRNRWLVDNSSYCIAYFNGNYGGTAYTVRYAKSRNVQIINIGCFIFY